MTEEAPIREQREEAAGGAPGPVHRAPGGVVALGRTLAKHWVPYTFIAPFYLLFGLFGLFPIAFTFVLMFYQWDGLGPMRFTGLENLQFLFADANFWTAVYNTLWIGIVAHVPMLILALVLASVLNAGIIKLKEAFQTAYFLPVITSSVAVTIVFSVLFGVRSGLVNYALTAIGLSPVNWWGGGGEWIKPVIVILFVWRWIGWNMVIYLAGLQSIPQELYEAASIDGASMVQSFLSVTLPLMKPVILFTLILSTVGALTIFDEPFLLVGTTGGTNRAGLTLMLYLYREAFNYFHFGYASAVAFVTTFFIVVISVVNWKIFGEDDGTKVRGRV